MLLENTYKILFKLAKEFKNYKFICKGKYGGMIKRRHFEMEKKFGKTSNLIFKKISNKNGSIIVCDDYLDASYITGVKKAVDTFVEKKGLKLQLVEKRFAKIII